MSKKTKYYAISIPLMALLFLGTLLLAWAGCDSEELPFLQILPIPGMVALSAVLFAFFFSVRCFLFAPERESALRAGFLRLACLSFSGVGLCIFSLAVALLLRGQVDPEHGAHSGMVLAACVRLLEYVFLPAVVIPAEAQGATFCEKEGASLVVPPARCAFLGIDARGRVFLYDLRRSAT